MTYILTAIATYISATLYRLGGASKEDAEKEYGWIPKWIRSLPKKRDAGCGIVSGLMMWYLFPSTPWWIHLIAFGALWGMLSTYWDWMFGDEDNFWMHGLMCGMAYLVYGFHNPEIFGWLALRAGVMAVFMGVWSHILFSDAWTEENGRGGIIPLSLLLLLI
jgi:hypothetical protein